VVLPFGERGAFLVMFADRSPTPAGSELMPIHLDQYTGERLAASTTARTWGDAVMSRMTPLHVGGVGDIGAIADDEESPVVAAEIVTTSISSSSIEDAEAVGGLVAGLKRIRHFNAVSRGYVSNEVTRAQWKISCFVVDTADTPTSPGNVEAELYVDVGVPGLRPA